MTAQVVVITEGYVAEYLPVKKIKWSWTTDSANGGIIYRLITNPGATAPTDDYDVTILDDDGYDVLMGAGADRDTANTEQVLASSLGCCVDSQLRLNIGTAGNSKVGEVILYVL